MDYSTAVRWTKLAEPDRQVVLMNFNVFSGSGGEFLITPQGSAPSPDAIASHGPLMAWGSIESDDHPAPALWRRVAEEIELHNYATLQKALGRQLLGLETKTHRAMSP
jgi:hypothetical protein